MFWLLMSWIISILDITNTNKVGKPIVIRFVRSAFRLCGKPVVLVINQMKRSFSLENCRKKCICSKVFLYSRLHRNARNITAPFCFSFRTITIPLDEIRGSSFKIWNSTVLSTETFFKCYTLVPYRWVCWKILLLHLLGNSHRPVFYTNGKHSSFPSL